MTTYRLFPSTNGPATPAANSNPITLGVVFSVSQPMWLDGYWWWVCGSGQATAGQKFALWGITGTGTGVVVASATVTSGTFTAGQWNYVPLTTPVALATGAPYLAATGLSSSFPDTTGQFGSGDPYAAGIVNGPLTAYSDQTGSNPAPRSNGQMLYNTGGSDPSLFMPGSEASADNFWIDVQVDTAYPAGSTLQLWPNYVDPLNQENEASLNYTLATEFTLSQSCTLNGIGFYSPSGATQLPTDCGIWLVSGQSLVSGTHLSSPSWSGAAGSGWVYATYTGVTLPAGDYKTSVFNGAGTPALWAANTANYWNSGGPGQNGITVGPMTAPNLTNATSPGQGTYNQGLSFAYPNSYTGGGFPAQTYWVDVLVTPASSGGGGTGSVIFLSDQRFYPDR